MIALPSDTKNICLSLSGGLDSTTLLHLLVDTYGPNKIKTLSFDYGQRHRIELEMSQKSAERLGVYNKIIKLDYLKDISIEKSALISGSILKPKTAEENAGDPQINTYIPFRNAQFSFITAAFAETHCCSHIALGLNQTDIYGYWDTSIDFVDGIQTVMNLNRKAQIEFLSPFVSFYKKDILLLAKELSVKFGFDVLQYTWSCYNGQLTENDFKECGVCNTCTEKLFGYIQAGYSSIDIMNKFNISEEKIKQLKEEING